MKPLHAFLISVVALTTQSSIPILAAEPSDNYILGTNDTVQMVMFQEPRMTMSGTITEEGTVTVGLIGQVKIAGLTPSGAAEKIRVLLEKDYFNNPKITLTVTQYRKQSISISGQVRSQGNYVLPVQENLNLIEAINLAGGFTTTANKKRVKLLRRTGSKSEVYILNAAAMADGKIEPFFVQPKDEITVGQNLF